jgi:pseudouridine-5'-monophosphatase
MEDLFKVFPQENRVLGDDPRIAPGRGKPAPDIYLLALKTINDVIKREGKEAEIKPEECLVFEDAVPGVEAGRRAGMQVVWCPHPGLAKEYEGREQEVLAGLTGTYAEGAVKDAGSPGKIDDGFATLLKTLENFPYEKFGMKVNAAA